jgi:pyrroline-5-carboxylate reductase
MQPTGHLVWTATEDELDRVTAVAGSGPGYAFELMRCWATAAEKLGFEPETARELVLRTLRGAAAMALDDDRTPTQLRDAVTSPRGTTQAGLDALNDGDVLDAHFERALRAAYARAVELR